MCALAQNTGPHLSLRTSTLENCHPSYLTPGCNHIHVKDPMKSLLFQSLPPTQHCFPQSHASLQRRVKIFSIHLHRQRSACLIHNLMFIKNEVFLDDTQSWVSLLKFHSPRRQLPNKEKMHSNNLKH